MQSIERHLLVWILGALSVGAVVLVIVSYFVALSEMNEILDENLKQVALSVASHELAGRETDAAAARRTVEPLAELDFAILSWTADGRLVFSSDPRLALSFDTVQGPSRVRSNHEAWQVFTVHQGDIIVQAAQRLAAREFEAAEVAAKLVPLLVVVVALIGLLLVAALRRGLKPLLRTAEYVGERTALSLEPIAHEVTPRELHSMIHAINRLMRRLSETFAVQRRFVADAAHELRTPVTALKLQVQLLERARGDGPRALAMAELKAGIERSEHLIAQLLALSRLEPGAWRHEARAVDLGALVRTVVGRMSVKADARHIDLGAEVSASVILQADPDELTVLLNNLVDNALRYTPTSGVVNVTAMRNGNTVVLGVVDTGPGIPQSERGRVFDRFYRGLDRPEGFAPIAGCRQGPDGTPVAGLVETTESTPGSGLGLSIVKAIAERHRAAVTLHTPSNGVGIEVRVTFQARRLSPTAGATTPRGMAPDSLER
jgi:two-component system OmpR family sensor kinase